MIKLALSILVLTFAVAAHAEDKPVTASTFYVISFDGVRSETQFYVEDANDPVLADKKQIAESYAKELQQQGTFMEGIELHVVRFDQCDDALCGKFIPVAGKYLNYKTASTACNFWSAKDITCTVVRVDPDPASRDYLSLCKAVMKWCTIQG